MFNRHQIAEFFATIFYIGKIKYCPGTLGSLVAFPLCYFITFIMIKHSITYSFINFGGFPPLVIAIFITILLCCLLLFVIGTYVSTIYVKFIKKEDPKEIIIDELVGQMLTLALSFFSIIFITHSKIAEYLTYDIMNLIFLFILPFSLFRFFDIIKPWPINYLDANIKGGIGVMIDDIFAAIFASVTHYIVTFVLIDWIK